jgi:hypothetical protein
MHVNVRFFFPCRSISKIASSLTVTDDRDLLHHARMSYKSAYSKLNALEDSDGSFDRSDNSDDGTEDRDDDAAAAAVPDDREDYDVESSSQKEEEPKVETSALKLRPVMKKPVFRSLKARVIRHKPVLAFKKQAKPAKQPTGPLDMVMPP